MIEKILHREAELQRRQFVFGGPPVEAREGTDAITTPKALIRGAQRALIFKSPRVIATECLVLATDEIAKLEGEAQ